MNGKCVLIVIVIILLAVIGWLIFKDDDTTLDDSIGYVSKIRSYVGLESSGQERPVDNKEDLYEGDTVKVNNEGQALLTFGSINVFAMNNSESGNIYTKGDPQASALVNILLRLGGLICNNEAGESQLVLTTPVDNKEVIVSSTWIFMVYDPGTGLTWVGNFEGHVQVDAGGVLTDIQPGKYVYIYPDQPAGPQLDIPFTMNQFRGFADDGFDALDVLQDFKMFPEGNTPPPPPEPNLGSAENPLSWAFVAYDDSTYTGFEELTALIYEQSGFVIQPYPASNETEMVEIICSGEAHIASLSAIPYLVASERGCAEAALVAMRFGDVVYNSMIFANIQSEINSMPDMLGTNFCRPDPRSTSGWIIPNLSLRAAGIDPDHDMEIADTGGHDYTVTAVYNYECDAGASYYDARVSVQTEYPDVMNVVRVIDISPDIPNDGVQFQPSLDDDLQAHFVDALLKTAGTGTGQEWFKFVFGWDALYSYDDSFYDGFRELLEAAGISAEDL